MGVPSISGTRSTALLHWLRHNNAMIIQDAGAAKRTLGWGSSCVVTRDWTALLKLREYMLCGSGEREAVSVLYSNLIYDQLCSTVSAECARNK